MKKYVKPELVFESFEMAQQIAVCDFDLKPNTAVGKNNETCAFVGTTYKGESVTIFLDGTAECTTKTQDSQDYCITNSSTVDTYIIFNS